MAGHIQKNSFEIPPRLDSARFTLHSVSCFVIETLFELLLLYLGNNFFFFVACFVFAKHNNIAYDLYRRHR